MNEIVCIFDWWICLKIFKYKFMTLFFGTFLTYDNKFQLNFYTQRIICYVAFNGRLIAKHVFRHDMFVGIIAEACFCGGY